MAKKGLKVRKLLLIALLICIAVKPLASAAVDPLDPWYRGYNEKYFNNELPKEILITHELHDNRFEAQTSPGVVYHIDFNPYYNKSKRQERMNLLHEMCHVRQFVSGEYNIEDDHDSRWQSCMSNLAKRGAFSDLW